jgi:hypothetical protein
VGGGTEFAVASRLIGIRTLKLEGRNVFRIYVYFGIVWVGCPLAPSGSRGGGFRGMIKFTATHNIIIVGLIITYIRYYVVVHTSKTI